MDNLGTITIYTQVYNTKKYLKQCIDSVLNQTYTNFEYLLLDNGCTDGSSEILQSFVAKDPRIRLFRNEKNREGWDMPDLVREHAKGEYFAILDSDDWLELDCLENLLKFAKKYDLDIACTGTVMHDVATGRQSFRKIEQALVLPRSAFAEGLPIYHVFFRTIWAKLIRRDLKAFLSGSLPKNSYGLDTVWCFQMLRHAKRIGIEAPARHHYRVHKSSISYVYNPERFASDVYLNNDLVDFLSVFGPVSARNRQFMQIVYANAVWDTLGVIHNSSLSPEDKLREYRAIALHPLTQSAYRECQPEDVSRSRNTLVQGSLYAGEALKKQEDEDLRAVMQALFPRSGRVVSSVNSRLFLEDQKLFEALLQDNTEMILQNLLTRVETNQAVKKYAIPESIQALAADNPLLCQIRDAVFLRKYAKIYWLVWQGENLAALEEMTGLLMEDRVSSGQETFLRLYISLSAVLEHEPAFVYGKLKLAQLYFRQNRLQECRALVTELEEMGLTDSEELYVLQHDLEATGL